MNNKQFWIIPSKNTPDMPHDQPYSAPHQESNMMPQNQSTQAKPKKMDEHTIAQHIKLARTALDLGTQELTHDITERLRVARIRALEQMQHKPETSISTNFSFNFGQWFGRLSQTARSAMATGAIAFVFLIALSTTRSDLSTQPSNQYSRNNTIELTAQNSNEATQAVISMANDSKNSPQNIQINARTAPTRAPTPALKLSNRSAKPTPVDNSTATTHARILVASHNSNKELNEDEQVDIILREKIPLQAYLNDRFTQFSQEHSDPVSSR